MLSYICDDCHRPIDPRVDNHIVAPDLTIIHQGKMGRFTLHFCARDHFISWLKKHGEPSGIITVMNPQGPAL